MYVVVCNKCIVTIKSLVAPHHTTYTMDVVAVVLGHVKCECVACCGFLIIYDLKFSFDA